MGYYLMIGDTPWCRWQACQAGAAKARESHVSQCSYNSRDAASDARDALQPYFAVEVTIGEGECPGIAEVQAAFFETAKLTAPSPFDARELATVLAALRFYQGEEMCNRASTYVADIATDGSKFEPLTVDEIDALCERINC